MTALLALPVAVPAQDAATEERMNKLTAQIEVLVEAKETQNKKIEALESQVRDLQSKVSQPVGNYASAEDLKQVADAVKEVDKKRQSDSERVSNELQKVLKSLGATGGGSGAKRPPTTPVVTPPNPAVDLSAPHLEYKVKAGDRIGDIVQAYRDKGVKVTVASVLALNPGLKPEKMKVGQTIIISATAQ